MKTCVVTNRKGGVGKTTLALHLAAAGVDAGQNTLLVDLDPQASASSIVVPEGGAGLAESLWDDEALVQPTRTAWGFDVLAASPDLSGAEALSLDETVAAIRRLPGGYDLIVFDTPPYFGTLQTAPLLLADVLIAPVEPDVFALQGLKIMQSVVDSLRPRNPALQLRVVANRLKKRSVGQMQTVDAMQAALRAGFVGPGLAEREGVRRARDAGLPVWHFAKRELYARDWKQVCDALIA
jgi:chromosome partitioning protein